jgi:hypothetical protein
VKGGVPKPPPLGLRCYNHHARKKWSIKVIIVSMTEVTINLKSKKNPYNEWTIRDKNSIIQVAINNAPFSTN